MYCTVCMTTLLCCCCFCFENTHTYFTHSELNVNLWPPSVARLEPPSSRNCSKNKTLEFDALMTQERVSGSAQTLHPGCFNTGWCFNNGQGYFNTGKNSHTVAQCKQTRHELSALPIRACFFCLFFFKGGRVKTNKNNTVILGQKLPFLILVVASQVK